MRVLWFTTILPKPVSNYLGLHNKINPGGGWIESLRLALKNNPDLELGIATASEKDYELIKENGAFFYNIFVPHQTGNVGAVYRRWLHRTNFQDELNRCLVIINKFNPDIIHIHGSENTFGFIKTRTSIPVVISIQGILTIYERFYFGSFTCKDKLLTVFSKGFLSGVDGWHHYLEMKNSAQLERKIIKNCKYFIGRTEFDRNFVSLIHPNSQYYACDEILRPPFYLAKRSQETSNTPTIYCTTSAVPYKGLDCLLNACHILKANGYPKIQLRIGGQIKDTSIWIIIKRRVEKLKLTSEIVWLSKLTSDAVVAELEKATVYVLPSYVENSPNSLAEAMLVGVPCVASYVGGVPSMIIHGKDGLLFPSGDAYSLAGMIAKILRDPILSRDLSENAKITARKRHDPQRVSATMMNIYSEIIDDSNVSK